MTHFKQSIKRVTAILLSLLLLISLLPATAMAEEPAPGLEVTSVTYNGDQAATITKLEGPITATRRTNSVTPENMFLAEINAVLDPASDIVVTTNAATMLFNIRKSYAMPSDDNGTTHTEDVFSLEDDYPSDDITFTGFTREEGASYYFMASGYEDDNSDWHHDNKAGLIICVKEPEEQSTEITSQDELNAFMKNAKTDEKGILKNDISLNSWKSINAFNGVLDGNGFSLSFDSASKVLCQFNNGTIENLTILGTLNDISGITQWNRGVIRNCGNKAEIQNVNQTYTKMKGGIASINDSNGIIQNCYNTSTISGMYIGGIVAENRGLIENCVNTGIIQSEEMAGGIAWQCHSGTIRNCYGLNLVRHAYGWDAFYGSYIEKQLGPIVGDIEDSSVSGNVKTVNSAGTIENCYYLDAYASIAGEDESITVGLNDLYHTVWNQSDGWNGAPVYSVAGWMISSSQTVFTEGMAYYAFYDVTHDDFIIVQKDASAQSNIIDTKNVGSDCITANSAGGASKNFFLVKIPEDSTSVQFLNTEKIIDYGCGYTNRYLNANLLLDHAGTTWGAAASEPFSGIPLDAENKAAALEAIAAVCGNDEEAMSQVNFLMAGVDADPGSAAETDIYVSFRLVGATLSESADYDIGRGIKDSKYITWIPTQSVATKNNISVGAFLAQVLTEKGIQAVGIENNYISGVYAPESEGGYLIGEFTNGLRSGWMYSVNGAHPDRGVNGYYLADGDEVVLHYINDYSYECSDWYKGDESYPNLGDETTWDPWLKIHDVAPEDLADAHNWDEGTVTKEAACTEDGEITCTCLICGDTKTEAVPASGHSFGKDGFCNVCKDFIFTDVDGDKSKGYVSWAYENGIVKGTGENTFAPDDGCTRAQFIMMLWKMNGGKAVKGVENPFSDVTGSKTIKAVKWALKEGIIKPADKFDPDGEITRIQIVMMLWKLAGSPKETGKIPFTDITGNKTTQAVLWAYNNGITKGTGKTAFSPEQSCTRLQLVIFLYKYSNLK